MRERFRGEEVWERLGYDTKEAASRDRENPLTCRCSGRCCSAGLFHACGTLGCGVTTSRDVSQKMGVLDMAGLNLDELMKDDEDKADAEDRANATNPRSTKPTLRCASLRVNAAIEMATE